jgi:hypothetical protein
MLIGRTLATVIAAAWLVLGAMHFADGEWGLGLLSVLVAVGWVVAYFWPRRLRSRNT